MTAASSYWTVEKMVDTTTKARPKDGRDATRTRPGQAASTPKGSDVSTVKNPIRDRQGQLTKTALLSGLSDQRAWLSVGMHHHLVKLQYNPHNEKYVVSYSILTSDQKRSLRDESRSFPRTRDGLTAARLHFRTAGRPGCWPDPKELS